MKRSSGRNILTGVALALAGAVAAAVFWLLATTSGAQRIVTELPRLAGIQFTAQTVEGRILDRLLLRQVHLGLGLYTLELDSFELHWKPLLLTAGSIAVRELRLNGVRIQDNNPPDDKPPVLEWPGLSRSAQLFDVVISRLRVTNLSYRRLQGQPSPVTSLDASVTWRDDALAISDLALESPSGRIGGSLQFGFNQPFLTTELAIVPAQPLGKLDRFSLQVQRGVRSGQEQLAGKVSLSASAGKRKLLELAGDVGLLRSALNLRKLTLTRPDRKGTLTGDGTLEFTVREPLLSLQVKADGLDLSPELHVATEISGILTLSGSMENYRGNFKLANRAKGWQALTVSADYRGTGEGLQLTGLSASILDGSLAGHLDLDWRRGFDVRGELSGRNINPARVEPDWQGVVNFTSSGNLFWSGASPVTGRVRVDLHESILHGQSLTGELRAERAGSNHLSVERLAVRGKGFDLHAWGDLQQRLNLQARISDLSRLIPESAGNLRADGWLRWNDGSPSGAVSASGSALSYAGTQAAAATLDVRLDRGADHPLRADLTLRDLLHGRYMLNSLVLAADGSLSRHSLRATLRSADAEARLALTADYGDGIWKGELTRLAGNDASGPWNLTAPSSFSIGKEAVKLSPLALAAGPAERVELSADLSLNPLGGQVRAQWTGLNLARATPYLKDLQVSGSSHGSIRLGIQPGKLLTLTGNAAGNGSFTAQGRSVTIRRSLVTVNADQQGMRAALDLQTADGGRITGTFSSAAPLRPTLPGPGELQGKLTAELVGIDLEQFKPWLPRDFGLEGRFNARTTGVLLPGNRFELDGSGAITGGSVRQQRSAGESKLSFTAASITWGWRGEALTGELTLTLAEYGRVRASAQLPLAARFPLAINPRGPLRATVMTHLQEKGVITALFPGLVQESFGELDVDLSVSGTWDVPLLSGTLRLARAGAYLPSAGIHLKDVQLAARLEKERILIDSFRAVSGPGQLEGTALLTLDGWRVTGYRGTIGGENFQTVNFPELRMLSSPKLRFEGDPRKLTLRGELLLPELSIVGAPTRKVVAPSSDVIREGAVAPPARAPALGVDLRVRVLLGEKVSVKAAGIDARLGGALDLSGHSLDSITSAGEIKVVKGQYRTYGVNLEIVRGRLFFAGGPLDRPTLDFLALRTIGDVRAGVTVSGTLQKPVTKLYSEPAMTDVDVLAYVVLGHPLGGSGEQAGLMTQAAGALLTSSQAGVLQEQIKNKLGLSTLEIQGGVGATPSSMGYKPLVVTPPGTVPAAQQPGMTETMLTVGKYLTPQLYISYGKSLFSGNNQFRLRYDIFKRWQIETQAGSESGADLYYKLEFR